MEPVLTGGDITRESQPGGFTAEQKLTLKKLNIAAGYALEPEKVDAKFMAAGWGHPWVRKAFATMSELRCAGETPAEALAELRRRDKEMSLHTSKE
eukprot:3851797-Rhodomonas_salina.1